MSAEENNMDSLSSTETAEGQFESLIMMVDDEPIIMSIIKEFLIEAGYNNFLLVDDSRQALEKLGEYRPDLLLLDLMMPHVDGFEILKAVRALPETKHLPIIVLTSANNTPTKIQALSMGATDFLSKPFDNSELVLRVRNTLTVKAYHDHLAHYDTLTGLPNRALFKDRLMWAIANAKREQRSSGILNIDLDRFKHINDTLGPQTGDALLKQVSQRLTDSIRLDDYISRLDRTRLSSSISRFGGDEFSLVLHDVSKPEHPAHVARRIIQAMSHPFFVNEHEIFLSTSIGIALYPADGNDIDELMKNAAAATEHAKHRGRSNYQFYSSELNAESDARFRLESELRKALEKGQFEVYYQAKIGSASNKVLGMEALVRWHHSERGLVGPTEFIEMAEDLGLIIPIGSWILNEVCRQHKEWMHEGLGPLKVSVNVSGRQFSDKDLCNSIETAIVSNNMDPAYLMLELTESVLMDNIENSIQTMHSIRKLGASLSIDDFGVGYSSLNYLKTFPIQELKIDRSFLVNLPGNKQDSAIIKAIIALANGLSLHLVAEGVERKEQVQYLNELGCDILQGFYFSKPLPADKFKQFVIKHNA